MGATKKKAGKAPKAKAPGRGAKLKPAQKDAQSSRVVSEVPRELAEKKKHVRELAKAGDWEQIKRLYGEKMVKKAKAYVEKNSTSEAEAEAPVAEQPPPLPPTEKMTPQLIAKQLLAMNGYSTKEGGVENPPQAPEITHPVTPQPPRKGQTTVNSLRSPSHSTPRQVRPQPSFRSPRKPVSAVGVGTKETPISILDSPETLTEEQKRRIEERRREALQKRKRVVEPVTPMVTSRGFHVIPGSVDLKQAVPTGQRSSAEARDLCERRPVHVLPPARPAEYSTPAKTVKHASIEQVMQDELEIAAQITDWDFEPFDSAPPRVVTPPACHAFQNSERLSDRHGKLPPRKDQAPQSSGRNTVVNNRLHQPLKPPVHTSAVAAHGGNQSRAVPVVSLSQELAAAADIARWEAEQEQATRKRSESAKPSGSRQAETTTQQFTNKRQPAGYERKPTSGPQPQPIPLRPPQRTAISNEEKEAKQLENFIAKHFLEDKLDAAVLDFVNMMLA